MVLSTSVAKPGGVTAHGLEVRIEPGNMWGPQNDAKNLLVRPAGCRRN